MNDSILLGHGSGGKLSQELINGVFLKYFRPEEHQHCFLTDSTLLHGINKSLAFTTDSYVVDPIFFPGGNIGKLAVCGTVNDLAVSGATPQYLSASFIIEEGFPLSKLEAIVHSMAEDAKKAGIKIVTGDTKIVNKGKCDGVFINTSGIGMLDSGYAGISTGEAIQEGDKIIINGSIGDHSIAVMGARKDLNIQASIQSDCAPLNGLIARVLKNTGGIRFMRDVTRGGLATVLAELTENKPYGTELDETKIPVKDSVRGVCEILGFDPLYLANEGKVAMVVEKETANDILNEMHTHSLGAEAAIIGEITSEHPGMNALRTKIGGKRIIDMLAGEQLPRIC